MTPPMNQDRPAWLHGASAECDVLPKPPAVITRLVLLGPPGVGKGTQAALLHDRLGACHLSTGDVFRNAGSRPHGGQTPAIREALAYMRRGELVPDATVLETVRERRACLHCRGGFILDGFPRTVVQAESLQRLLDQERLQLTAVINYDLPVAAIVERLAGRRTCSQCKAVYHLTERPPELAGRCDLCQGALFQREDDEPESIRVRLETYKQSTAPLIDFYRKLNLLILVPASGTADEIYVRTMSALSVRPLRS